MRASTIKKLAYQPMIKFVGGPHVFEQSSTHQSLAHVCSPNGLVPKSPECLSIKTLMENWKPLEVKPYKNPAAKTVSSSTNNSPASKVAYTNRPLFENEVASISALPQTYRFRPIDDLEMDIIMGGGAP